MMGFLHNAVCFPTYDEAMSVKFGTDAVLITTSNSVDKLHFFEHIAGSWYWTEYTTTGGVWTLAYNSPLPVINFPSCVIDPLQSWDPLAAAAFWTFAFSFTIGLWFLAKNLGIVLDAIKRF